jgi:hypothetical protein
MDSNIDPSKRGFRTHCRRTEGKPRKSRVRGTGKKKIKKCRKTVGSEKNGKINWNVIYRQNLFSHRKKDLYLHINGHIVDELGLGNAGEAGFTLRGNHFYIRHSLSNEQYYRGKKNTSL